MGIEQKIIETEYNIWKSTQGAVGEGHWKSQLGEGQPDGGTCLDPETEITCLRCGDKTELWQAHMCLPLAQEPSEDSAEAGRAIIIALAIGIILWGMLWFLIGMITA